MEGELGPTDERVMTKLFEKQWEGSGSLPSWVYLPPSILLSCIELPAAPHIGPALSDIK